MTNRHTLASVTILPSAAADQISPEGIVQIFTSEIVNQTVIFSIGGAGITFGGLVTICLGIGAIIVMFTSLAKFINILIKTKRDIDAAKQQKKEIENGIANTKRYYRLSGQSERVEEPSGLHSITASPLERP